MTGPQHYAEAERLLRQADGDFHTAANRVARAQVHATLAAAAASAYPAVKDAHAYWGEDADSEAREWRDALTAPSDVTS